MKRTGTALIMGLGIGMLTVSAPPNADAQQVVEKTTTTTLGTVTEFSPSDRILIRSESVAEPIRYSVNERTTIVDETGAPVAVEMIRSGLPVTVYYTTEGERTLASKIVVRKQQPSVIEKREVIEERVKKGD